MPPVLAALLFALSCVPASWAGPAKGASGKEAKTAPKEAPTPAGPAFGAKPFGLLLVGPGGGADWDELVRSVHDGIKKEHTPFETVTGSLDPKLLQRAVDRLEASRIEKLVVAGVYLDSRDEELDQLRYLLGIAQYPSEAYLQKWGIESRSSGPRYGSDPSREKLVTNSGMKERGAIQRLKAKVPIVLAGGGLDADKAVSETLIARAKDMSRDPKGEAVILLGEGHPDSGRARERQKVLDALALELQKRGGFRATRALLMPPSDSVSPGPKEDYPRSSDKRRLWPKSGRVWEERGPEEELRAVIRSMSVERRVLLLPCLLERDGTERLWRKQLDNLFFQWKGQGLLPSKAITAWVLKQAADGSRSQGMVRFKDQGQALPSSGPERGRK